MLVVANLKNATRWYQKALGFRLLFEMPHLAHLQCPRNGHLLLMGDGHTAPVPGGALTFGISKGSVDELAENAVARGADILVGPVDQPWNRREVTLKDPDGHRLTFVQTQRRVV